MDRRLKRNQLIGFNLFTTAYELHHVGDHFYNWLFCIAIHQNEPNFMNGFENSVNPYKSFTDLYVKAQPHACQARAVAIAISLKRCNKWDWDAIKDLVTYKELVTT